MPIRMTAQTQDMSGLFNNKYFTIPKHQRQFAWLDKQCEDLMNDLDAISKGVGRFMGYITIVPIATEAKHYSGQDYNQYQILDGQQRITALTILISTLVHEVNLRADSDVNLKATANKLKDDFICFAESATKLKLQELPDYFDIRINDWFYDFLFFKSVETTIPSQKRMCKAKDLFKNWVAEKNNQAISELIRNLRSEVYFIVNEAHSTIESADVFEGLNNRGKKLSPLEHLKTHFMYIGTKCIDTQADNQLILSNLSNPFSDIDLNLEQYSLSNDDEEKNLIDNYWVITQKIFNGKITIKPGISIEKTSILDILSLNEAIKNQEKNKLLELCQGVLLGNNSIPIDLVRASKYYCDINRPSKKGSFSDFKVDDIDLEEIKGLSQCLVNLKVSRQLTPLLMAFRFKFDSIEYLKLLRLLERITFWVYASGETTKFTALTKSLAKDIILDNKTSDKILSALVPLVYPSSGDNSFRKWAIDSVFESYEEVNRHSPSDKWKVLAYFLFEWNRLFLKQPLSYSSVVKQIKKEPNFVRLIPVPVQGGGRIPEPFDTISLSERKLWCAEFSNIFVLPSSENTDNLTYDEKLKIIFKSNQLIDPNNRNIFFPKIGKKGILGAMEKRRKALIDWALGTSDDDLSGRWSVPSNGVIESRYTPSSPGILSDDEDDDGFDS